MNTTWILDSVMFIILFTFPTKPLNIFHSIVHDFQGVSKALNWDRCKRDKIKGANEFSHIVILLHNFLLDSQRRNVKEGLFSRQSCS